MRTNRHCTGTFKLLAGEQLINRNTGALCVAYYGDNTPLPASTSGLLIAHTFVLGGPDVTPPPATPPAGKYKIDNVTPTYAASSGTYVVVPRRRQRVLRHYCRYIDTMFYQVIIYTMATGGRDWARANGEKARPAAYASPRGLFPDEVRRSADKTSMAPTIRGTTVRPP